jgi:serine protease
VPSYLSLLPSLRTSSVAALLVVASMGSALAEPGQGSALTPAEGRMRLEARLRNMGFGADKPVSMPASIDSARQIKKAMQGSERVARPGQVDGLAIRFRAPEVQALSASNAPPPEALIAQLNGAAGGDLRFHRAMSMGFHVFRFSSPKTAAEVEAIVARVRALPEVEQVTEDVRSTRNFTPNDISFPKQWNMQSAYTLRGLSQPPVRLDDHHGLRQHDRRRARHRHHRPPGVPVPCSARLRLHLRPVHGQRWQRTGRRRQRPGRLDGRQRVRAGTPGWPSSWHGTHVTGIIAAAGNNWSGMAGTNWNTRILPVRVLGKCGGSVSDIIDGMLWAVGLAVPGVPLNPYPAQVLNLSLGGWSPGGCTAGYEEALNRVRATGALVVAAAGNDDTESAYVVPAACDGVMTVGAVDHDGYRASYSNYSFVNTVSISALAVTSATTARRGRASTRQLTRAANGRFPAAMTITKAPAWRHPTCRA